MTGLHVLFCSPIPCRIRWITAAPRCAPPMYQHIVHGPKVFIRRSRRAGRTAGMVLPQPPQQLFDKYKERGTAEVSKGRKKNKVAAGVDMGRRAQSATPGLTATRETQSYSLMISSENTARPPKMRGMTDLPDDCDRSNYRATASVGSL